MRVSVDRLSDPERGLIRTYCNADRLFRSLPSLGPQSLRYLLVLILLDCSTSKIWPSPRSQVIRYPPPRGLSSPNDPFLSESSSYTHKNTLGYILSISFLPTSLSVKNCASCALFRDRRLLAPLLCSWLGQTAYQPVLALGRYPQARSTSNFSTCIFRRSANRAPPSPASQPPVLPSLVVIPVQMSWQGCIEGEARGTALTALKTARRAPSSRGDMYHNAAHSDPPSTPYSLSATSKRVVHSPTDTTYRPRRQEWGIMRHSSVRPSPFLPLGPYSSTPLPDRSAAAISGFGHPNPIGGAALNRIVKSRSQGNPWHFRRGASALLQLDCARFWEAFKSLPLAAISASTCVPPPPHLPIVPWTLNLDSATLRRKAHRFQLSPPWVCLFRSFSHSTLPHPLPIPLHHPDVLIPRHTDLNDGPGLATHELSSSTALKSRAATGLHFGDTAHR
ncbi:hypothetical protein C8J57DRAFT_1535605 [Mycena rebaudengoi]|nr:hypothetical protein C8J57DRAFT_1535605 [Mycena rebaudengoi]